MKHYSAEYIQRKNEWMRRMADLGYTKRQAQLIHRCRSRKETAEDIAAEIERNIIPFPKRCRTEFDGDDFLKRVLAWNSLGTATKRRLRREKREHIRKSK